MDWLATNWPMVVVLMALAAAWGRTTRQILDIQEKLADQHDEICSMRNAELARREKLAGELESIRIALTEIRTQLEIRNGFR